LDELFSALERLLVDLQPSLEDLPYMEE